MNAVLNSSIAGQRVVVTSANSRTGMQLIPRLKAAGAQVIALVRKPTDIPDADQIVTNWMVAPEAFEALRAADLIVHLTGEFIARTEQAYIEANVTPTERVVEAIQAGKARRVVSMSYLGADEKSRNIYLRVNGVRERLLMNSRADAVIFRCPGLFDAPSRPGPAEEALTSVDGKPVQMLGNGQQRQQVVYRGDVVNAILAALQRGAPGIYDLVGPDALTMDNLVQIINRNPSIRISHTPAWLARIIGRFIPDLSPTYVDIMLQDAVADPRKAVETFGLKLTSVREVWTANASTPHSL